MACDDRQLTEAQRQAAFNQLRNAGAVQAIRPFTGQATPENLVDYLNREVFPVLKQTRKAVNDVYRPVLDNAPSGNPLIHLFSESIVAADPTNGFIRLDNADAGAATTIRVSELNQDLRDIGPWLDVMAGSVTSPLGAVTLFHQSDPRRFARYDLVSMTDQGTYWDLGVTPIEASDPVPWREGDGVVLGFIPGVSSGTTTVPPSSIGLADGPRQFLSSSTGTAVDWRSLSGIFPGAPIYDVMAHPFSATGDGVADDLAAINSAIAAANASPGVIFLSGSHRISAALDAITASCVVLRGRGMDGGGTTLTCSVAPTGGIITIGAGARFSGVEELRVGSSVASQSGYAIVLTESFRCFVRNVRTLTTGSGVEVDRCNTTFIENVDVTDTIGPYGFHVHGVDPDFNHVTRFSRCQVGRSYPLSINAGRGDWGTGVVYALGDIVRSNGGLWQCSIAGTSGASAPNALPSSSASTVHTATFSDGGVTWRYAMGAFEGFANGSFSHTLLYQECGVLQGYRGFYAFDDQGNAPTFIHGWQCSVDHPLFTGVHLEACDGAVMFDQTLATSILISGQPGITIGANATRWQFNGGEANQGVTVAGTAGVLRGMHLSTVALASTADEVLVEHNHITGAMTIASGADNYVVSGNYVAGGITNTPGRSDTRVVFDNVPDTEVAVGSVWGLQIDHGASDVPREVTKFELGENLRRETVVTDTTSSGTSATYPIASTTTQVQFKLAGALTVNGMTAATLTFGKLVVFSFDSGFAGSVTWNNESGSAGAALERVRTPGGVALTISAGETAVFEYFDSRWRCISWGRANSITDGDKGDVTVSSSGTVWTIDNNAVSNAKLRDSGALSVIGRSANSAGDPADISATAASNAVLRENGNVLGFGTVNTGGIADDAVTFAKMQNVGYGVIGNPAFGTTASPQLLAPPGSFTVLQDNGTGTLAFNSLATTSVVHGALGVFERAALTGDVTASQNSNSTTIANDAVTNAKAANMAQSTIKGRAEGAGTGDPTDLTPTQVIAIVDAESPTWTGSHTHNGATHTVSASGAMTLRALGAYTLVHNGGDHIQIDSDDGTGAGLGLEAAAAAPDVVAAGDGMFWLLGSGANNAIPMYREGADNDFPLVGKPINLCYWYEDFEFVSGNLATSIAFLGSGNWNFELYGAAGGSFAAIAAEVEHPGIGRLSTHTVSGTAAGLVRGAPGGLAWVRGDMIREFNVVMKLPDATTIGFFMGFSSDPNLDQNLGVNALTTASDFLGFFFDTAGAFTDTTVHCCSREASGTALDTDSAIAPTAGVWRRYTIRQTALGTVEYLIDGSIVATHSSQIPDTETMGCGVVVLTRVANARTMDVDYIDFMSHPLAR